MFKEKSIHDYIEMGADPEFIQSLVDEKRSDKNEIRKDVSYQRNEDIEPGRDVSVPRLMAYEDPIHEDDHCILNRGVALGEVWNAHTIVTTSQSSSILRKQERARHVPFGLNTTMDEKVASQPETITESEAHHLQDFRKVAFSTIIALLGEDESIDGLPDAIAKASKKKTSRRIPSGTIYSIEEKNK